MKKKKHDLNELKVKSFVTGLNSKDRNTVLGGKPEDTFHPQFCQFQSIGDDCDTEICEPYHND